MTSMPDYRPLLSLIELTLRCNLRCMHCGSSAGRARSDELSLSELEGVVMDLADLGCRELVFLGGEPLLHQHWQRLCCLTVELNMAPILVSNGILLDGEMARKIVAAHVDRVGVSIDGASPSTHDRIRGKRGSFERAWDAVERLIEQGVKCSIITTVTRVNIGELDAMRDQIAGRNIGWQIQTGTPNGARFDAEQMLSSKEFYRVAQFIAECRSTYSLEELPVAGAHDIGFHSTKIKNYAQRPEWVGCLGGISSVGIQSDGVIKPCLSLPADTAEGNIRDRGGLSAVWKHPERFVRNRLFQGCWLEGGCRGCVHGSTCRAGCPDVAWNLTRSWFDNPHCLYRIERESGLT